MKDYNAMEMEIKYNVLKAQNLLKEWLDDARCELEQAKMREWELEGIVMTLERAWELTESSITGESLDRAENELTEAWKERIRIEDFVERLEKQFNALYENF